MQGTDASALLGVRLETAKSEGRIYTAYPNLANVRWLLPANQPTLRRAGIEGLYQPNSLRGRALRKIIGAGALQGEKVWLEEDSLARLERDAGPVMGVEAVRLAFYMGVPAPHRKVTAQVLTPTARRWLTPSSPLLSWPRRPSKPKSVPCCAYRRAQICKAQYQRCWALWSGRGHNSAHYDGSPASRSQRALICAPGFLHAAFPVLQGAANFCGESDVEWHVTNMAASQAELTRKPAFQSWASP